MGKTRIVCAVTTILLSVLSLFIVTGQGQAASRPAGEAGIGITVLPATATPVITDPDSISNVLGAVVVVAVEPVAPPSGGGGTGGTYRTDGTTYIFDITPSGKVMANIEAQSHDGKASVDIDYGTIAKDKDGKAIRSIQIEPLATIPTLPEGANVMGIPYEYSPSGATFDPVVTITFKYDPAKVPDGTDLQLVFWNGLEWIQLTDVVVDPATGTVSGKTTHFTVFAVLAVPKPVPPATTPPATTPPATTPPATTPPVTTPPATTPPATTPPATTPPATTPPATTPPVTTTPIEVPMPAYWWYIIGIVGVIVIGVIVFVVRRKRG